MHAKWVENVNKNAPGKIVPTKGSRLCSAHFSVDMVKEDRERVILKPNAVPTIFNFSQVGIKF